MTPDPVPPARRDEGELLDDATLAEMTEEQIGATLDIVADCTCQDDLGGCFFHYSKTEQQAALIKHFSQGMAERIAEHVAARESAAFARGREEALAIAMRAQCRHCEAGRPYREFIERDGSTYWAHDLPMTVAECQAAPIRALLGGADREAR